MDQKRNLHKKERFYDLLKKSMVQFWYTFGTLLSKPVPKLHQNCLLVHFWYTFVQNCTKTAPEVHHPCFISAPNCATCFTCPSGFFMSPACRSSDHMQQFWHNRFAKSVPSGNLSVRSMSQQLALTNLPELPKEQGRKRKSVMKRPSRRSLVLAPEDGHHDHPPQDGACEGHYIPNSTNVTYTLK